MEMSEIRRRIRAAIDDARHESAGRRARRDEAARDYEQFLQQRAVPLFKSFAAALAGEGQAFKVFTPAGCVRLAAERSHNEFIELALDDTEDPPQVLGRSSRGRGRRLVTSERPVSDGTPISALSDEHVLAFLLQEITTLIER